jgi:uncharacterized protein involved in outer membrane biogenesis
MRIVRGLLTGLLLLALLLVLGAGALFSPAGERFVRDRFVAWASAALGREVGVDGDLVLEPGIHLRATATGLRLANAAWGSEPQMVTAQRISIVVDLRSLFGETLIVDEIAADALSVLLERTAEGAQNWDFELPSTEDEEPWLSSLPVIIDRVTMPGARLRFIGPRLTRPLDIQLAALEQARAADDMLDATLLGRVNETELELRARAGPFVGLVAAKDFRIDLHGTLGELALDGSIRVDDLAHPIRTEAALRVRGPDAAYLTEKLGMRRLGDGPLDLAATVQPAANGRGITGAFSGKIGGFDIDTSAELDEPARMAKLTLDARVSGPDLSLLGGLAGVEGLPAEPFRLAAKLRRVGQTLRIEQGEVELSDTRVEAQGEIARLDQLAGVSLRLQAQGADIARIRKLLRIPGVATGAFDAKATLRAADSGQELVEFEAKTSAGRLSLSGRLGAYPDYYGTRLQFSASGADIGALGRAAGWADSPGGAFEASGGFEWTRAGARLRDSALKLAGDRLELNGIVGRRPKTDASDLRFVLAGPNLGATADRLGIGKLPSNPYRIAGEMTFAKNVLRLTDVDFDARDASGRINAEIGWPAGNAPARIDISAGGDDLRAVVPYVARNASVATSFRLKGRAAWQPGRWSFDGMQLEVAGAHATLDGDIDQAAKFAASGLHADLHAPDLSKPGQLLGLHLPALPLDLNATFSGSPQHLRVDDLSARLGDSDFKGSFALSRERKPDLTLSIRSDLIDLRPFLAPAATVRRTRLIPEWELPLAMLGRANARLSVQSGRVRFRDDAYDNLRLEATLADGRLTVDPIALSGARGSLQARMEILPGAGPPAVRISLTGRDLLFSLFPSALGPAGASRYQADIELDGHGRDLRELAAGVTGKLRITGTGGQLSNTALSRFSGDFLVQLLSALNPFVKRQPYTDLVCQTFLLKAAGGTMRTDPALVMRTKEVDMISEGSVDLRNEKIDFNFRTAARKGIGLSAGEIINPYIKVSGTLASPTITLDPKGTLVSGGAAVATGGLSILAVAAWDRIFREKDPCAATLREADKRP